MLNFTAYKSLCKKKVSKRYICYFVQLTLILSHNIQPKTLLSYTLRITIKYSYYISIK